MRRYVPLLIAGLATLAAACSDATAPASVSSSSLSAANVSAAAARGGRRGREHRAEFEIPASGGRVHVGEFWLTFPADAVCDPRNSGYGPEYWDLECKTVKQNFRITAKYWSEHGESIVEFSPDIRFAPDKVVLISTVRPELIGKSDLNGFDFSSWSNSGNGRVKNKYWDDDPSLVTWFDSKTGEVFRRILHFSGISISSGAIGEYGSSDY